jgi:hypothetical protein
MQLISVQGELDRVITWHAVNPEIDESESDDKNHQSILYKEPQGNIYFQL